MTAVITDTHSSTSSPVEDEATSAGFLARVHPNIRLLAVMGVSVATLATGELRDLAAMLVFSIAMWPLTGQRWGVLARMFCWIGLASAPAVFIALKYGQSPPETYGAFFGLGPGPLSTGLFVALRLYVVMISGQILLSGLTPGQIAAALSQGAKLPSQYALVVAVSLELAGELRETLTQVQLSRRARGMGRRWLGVRAGWDLCLAVLVYLVHRATSLSEVMQARGVNPDVPNQPRTWRPDYRYRWLDAAFLAAVAVGIVFAQQI